MPVVAAFEFHDIFALGISAGQTDGRHSGFRTRVHEADFLHLRKRGDDEFRQIGFRRSGRAEGGSVPCRGRNRLDYFWSSMPENKRPPGTDVVDVLVAVGVEEMRSLTADDERRVAFDGAKSTRGRIYSSGNELLGTLLQLPGLLEFTVHGLRKRRDRLRLVIYR